MRKVKAVFALLCVLLMLTLVGCGKSDTDSDSISSSGALFDSQKTEELYPDDIWDGTIANGYESGYGTREDPYVITTGAQLAYLASQVNSGFAYEGQYYVLGADLYLNNPDEAESLDWGAWFYAMDTIWNEDKDYLNLWTPIGTPDNPFAGNFDGRKHTISCGLVYMGISDENISQFKNPDRTYSDVGVGLFGNVEGGVIQNVCIERCYVEGWYDYYIGHMTAGTLIGYVDEGTRSSCVWNCQISNCSVRIYSDGVTGGVVGKLLGKSASLDNCAVYNTEVYCTTGRAVGGIAGCVWVGNLSYCYSDSVHVSCDESSYFGGICGEANDRDGVSIRNCIAVAPEFYVYDTNYFELSDTPQCIGSIAGCAEDVIFTNCFFAAHDGENVPRGIGWKNSDTSGDVSNVPYAYIIDPDWIGQYLGSEWKLAEGERPVLW